MTTLVSKHKLIKSYKLDFGYIEIYPKFVIGIINDGIDLSLENLSDLIAIADIHYRNKNYSYISYRKNAYAINPTLYEYIKDIDNLKLLAIVSSKELYRHNFKIEKYFYGKEMKLFKNLEDSVKWVLKKMD
ncbi:STAS/SEC14 domain-containing protein [Joostella atrarenae]|uniref:STAS/SEC14 domain-containing protein n=1 Tax=Joostella atrarenae TaxID=679257 RepID=A0ABS9J5S4_9FLAO|nr:STAS/SEC14 domain-containing protein [Joostella atrarenae]MCF8715754.1 STAS/SEC14 domain-containing protein [Joostella atrarenae]